MKKAALALVTLLLIVGASGSALLVSGAFEPAPETVVCEKLVDVCNLEADSLPSCEADLGAWIAKHPDETAEVVTCVQDADSCMGVGGCVAGGGLKTLGAGVRDFFDGMGRILSR